MLIRQLGYRLLISIPVLLCVIALGFVLMMMIPSDPAAIIAGDHATPAALEEIRESLGLNKPMWVQFLLYIERLLQGDMGKSFLNSSDVFSELSRSMEPTAELVIVALLIAIPLGIGMGAAAAWSRGGFIDRLVMALAALGMSAPVFMTGLLLISVVGVHLGWLPVQGRGGPVYTWDGLSHIILPAITVSFIVIGPIARITRTSMLAIINEDFVRTARAKGIGERRVMIAHVLRNALIPTVNVIGLQAGYLLGGVVVTENIFAWPGIGRLAIISITTRDVPMAQGTILFLAISFVMLNIVVDLIGGYLDPRAQRL